MKRNRTQRAEPEEAQGRASRIRTHFRDLPIRRKMLAAFLLLILAQSAVYVGSSSWLLERVVHRQMESELENAATYLTDVVQLSVDASIKSYLRGIAEKNLELVTFMYTQAAEGRVSSAQARKRATDLLLEQRIGKTGYIYVVDGQGVIQVHPSRLLIGKDLTREGFIREQIRHHTGYLEYDWANPGEPHARPKALYMTYFEPWDWIISVSSYREEFRGLVDAGDFRERFLDIHIGDTGYPFVLDMQGRLVVHPSQENALVVDAQDATGRKFIREILDKRTGLISYPWLNPGDNRPRQKLTAFRHLPEMGWIIAASSYMEDFTRARIVFLWTTCASLLLSGLLVAVALSWIRRAVSHPLGDLLERISHSGGGLGATKSTSRNEVDQLQEAFDDLLVRIEESRVQTWESEHRYRGLFENAVEGIFQTDEAGRFRSANPSMAALLGYSSPEELMASINDIGTQIYKDPGRRKELWALIRDKGVVHGFEAEFFRKDGSTIWISLSARAFPQDRGGLCVNGFLVDITLEKENREELDTYRNHLEEMVSQRTQELTTAKEQAEAATRAKSVFLANMSHELRTPLNAVLGYSQIMAKSVRDPALTANVERILRAGEHLLELINDVLSMSRIEAGRVNLQPEPFNPRALFRTIEGMIRVRSDAKGLAFTMSLPQGLPEVLMGDGPKLRQILVNLLSNAVKFTDRGQVQLTITRAGNLTGFAVEDTGIGIAPEDHKRIFQLFEQVGDEKRAADGTGLGLHISQMLVRLMGGELEVQSEPGKGSRFCFAVPLPASGASSREEFHEARIPRLDPDQKPPRLLVVDDVEDNREVLQAIFTAAGIEVRSADSGPVGLDLWEAWNPDMVWLDLRMPGMDGWEVVRKLRQREDSLQRPRTIVIAITASVLTLDKEELVDHGFDGWIMKPIRIAPLFGVLEQQLRLRFQKDEPTGASPEPREPMDLAGLPAGWLEDFTRALELGDSGAMLEALDALEGYGLAQELRPLVQGYRYEELRRLLNAGGTNVQC